MLENLLFLVNIFMVKKSVKNQIVDQRFAKIYNDPRFRTLARKERKVQLDPRFSSMFTSAEFQGPISKSVDERGKKVTEIVNPLARVFDTSEIQCIDEEGNFKWEVQSSSSSEPEIQMEIGTDLYQEENVPTGEETLRLAIMNCDWNLIKAVDLLAILRSISPGVIKVSIYPSEFGKTRMEKEAQTGPIISSSEVDEEALRKYELETMKYYYAVAECDSLEASKKLYDECDGLEIERTSNSLDLRFVPNEVVFPYAPTDIATEVPKKYKMLDYYTKALQQSRVTLTWDETPRERVNTLRKAFQVEDMDEEELSKYIATPSPVNESAMEEIEERFVGKQSQFNKMNENLDLEIKFHSAFDNAGKQVLKDDQDKSVWDKFLDKKKQKKKEMREKRKERKADKKPEDLKAIENLKLLVDQKGDQEEFQVDLEDRRFAQLYTDSAYGIDPTSNNFKVDSDGNKLMLNMQIKNRKRNT